MKANSGPDKKVSKLSRRRSRGDLSEAAIKRRMRSEAVQHPAILLPLSVFVVSVIYLLLLSPVIGGGLWAIALLVISGLLAAVAFVFRYVFCYEQEYSRQVQEIVEQMDQEWACSEKEEIGKLRDALHFGFFSNGSAEGLNALSALVSEYEQLQPMLRHHEDMDPLSMSQLPGLAGEAYRRGLSALSDALKLTEAAGIARGEKMKRESIELEKEVETFKGSADRLEWLRIKEGRLALYKERLGILHQAQLRVTQLLFQAELCEASLHRTRIEVAAIRTGNSETSVDTVIQALEATIRQVKEVQEELKRLGY